MKRISVVFLILCTCCVPATWSQNVTCPAHVNWTEFLTVDMARYNPCETVLGVDNVGDLTRLWTSFSGSMEGSPVVVNGVVYGGSVDAQLVALKASTGHLLWTYPTGGAVADTPAVANGVVYFGSDDNNLYALNAATGALLWNYATGSFITYSSPAVAQFRPRATGFSIREHHRRAA